MPTYKYPKTDLTADFVLFYFDLPIEDSWKLRTNVSNGAYVLLVKRSEKSDAFPGYWSVPGGYVNVTSERIKDAAIRELGEETQVYATNESVMYPGVMYVNYYDDPERDPRGRVISHAFTAVSKEKTTPKGSDDADEAQWFPVEKLPDMTLAFDHNQIVREAYLKVLES